MRDVNSYGGYLSVCKCCCCCSSVARAGDGQFCDSCLQVVKQCPPKKRFMRAGCIKPRPVIVKPASSIALDRLVEVALSPTDLDTSANAFDCPSGHHFLKVDLSAGHGPGVVSSGENGVTRSVMGGAAGAPICKDDAAKKTRHTGTNKQAPPKQATVPSLENKQSRYSLPLEDVQKLKRLSSLDDLSRPRSSTHVHADHPKRFTPRFKSLLDISC